MSTSSFPSSSSFHFSKVLSRWETEFFIFFIKISSLEPVLQEVAQRSTVFKTTARKGEDEEIEEEVAEALDEEDIYRQQVFSFRADKIIYVEKMEM